MTDSVTVEASVDGDVATLSWSGGGSPEALASAVSAAAEEHLAAGARRLQAGVAAADLDGRRALHLAGFRREGLRRQVLPLADGGFDDEYLYARLADDPATGAPRFSAVMNSVLPMKRLIAHVVFRNERDEVLLLQTTYKSDWELPGGVVEPEEPARIGAEREVFEELGHEVQLGSPALVDWMPPYLGWSDAVEFIYDAGTLHSSALDGFTTEPHEIRAAHWVPREELDQRVSPLSARRIRLILDGFTGFTEDGQPV